MAIPGFGLPKCVNCGKKAEPNGTSQPEKVDFTKCIKCGKVYCSHCWQPEYFEICPVCSSDKCCN